MGLRKGPVGPWLNPPPAPSGILAERRRWLGEEPARHAAQLPGSEPLLRELAEFAAREGFQTSAQNSTDLLMELAEKWEFDFLLLRQQESLKPPLLVAGVVCFPSSWSLAEKIGKPLDEIHVPVPSLNSEIGLQITTFLNRLPPNTAWERANWGLSASGELNQHPHRGLPRLTADATWESAWLRIEQQALIALPRTNGIFFAIKIQTFPLIELQSHFALVQNFRIALQTMPEEMARYKNLHLARAALLKA